MWVCEFGLSPVPQLHPTQSSHRCASLLHAPLLLRCRRGTAPRCYDTCDAGETVVATDRYGGGALCIGGYGHKFLCEVRLRGGPLRSAPALPAAAQAWCHRCWLAEVCVTHL